MKTFYKSGVLMLCIAFSAAHALSGDEERRYYYLLKELRCLVCQNQSLADSDAELAGDLRREVLEMVERGLSNEEIFQFMTVRYGDFVLYKPRFKPQTYFLWLGPFLLLAVGLAVLFRHVAKRRPQE